MLRALLANRAAPVKFDVFQPCRSLLEKFHSAKNDHSCQAALCRLWEPLLWRHLTVANALVRRSSAEMLFDAFPVENPDAHIHEKASSHDAQYKIMLELLADPDVEVRVTAVHGVARIIIVFWPILPTTFLSQAMRYMMKDLAFDAASPKVRAAVLKGTIYLME
jgi:condensin-2 complex subunit G2